jgi:hypothetical protein
MARTNHKEKKEKGWLRCRLKKSKKGHTKKDCWYCW